MKNSLIRVLISLFLCCCLVLNVAAMPVRASSFGSWLLLQIGTNIGVSAILEGLGIFRDSASDYFGELVDEVSDALDTAGQVSVGFMNAYYKVDPLGAGSPLFAFPLSLITFVRNWVFDNGVVKTSSDPRFDYSSDFSVNGKSGSVQSFTPFSLVLLYMPIGENFYGSVYAYSTEDFDAYLNGSGVGNVVKYDYYYATPVFSVGSVPFPIDSNIPSYSFQSTNEFSTIFDSQILPFNPRVVTDKPISLGYVGLPTFSFTSAYPQWLEHQRELEDGTTETLVQIGLGNTQAETESLTQEQIWTGQGTLQIPEQGQTEVTLQDILQGLIQLPGQMVTSIQTALQAFFVPSGNIQAYSLDLKALFPFCIPFDIYDFLAALSADPVAPVFEFDLNLGVATEPMKIDLSNWSDLAAIIRTLELGLFCVGLALKTRELIGG